MKDTDLAKNTIAIFDQTIKAKEEAQKISTSNQELLEKAKEILLKKALLFMNKIDNLFSPITKAATVPIVESYSYEIQGNSILYLFTYSYGELGSSILIEPVYDKQINFVSKPTIKITKHGFMYSHPSLAKEIFIFTDLLSEFDKLCAEFEDNFCESIMSFAKSLLNEATDNLDQVTKDKDTLNAMIENNKSFS